jgi:hypothetical protein
LAIKISRAYWCVYDLAYAHAHDIFIANTPEDELVCLREAE